MRNKIVRITLVTAAVLAVPLLGGWPWTSGDFVVMGALVFSMGLAYEVAVANIADSRRRAVIGAVLLAVFLLIWADLAVGIFNIPGISGS